MVAKIVTHLINQWGFIEVLANKGRKKTPSSILFDLRLFKCFWALKHLILRVQPLLCALYRTEWKTSALPQPEQFIFGFNYTKYSKLVGHFRRSSVGKSLNHSFSEQPFDPME